MYNDIARDNYFDAQFSEMTGDGSLASYIEFVELNSESPMVIYAEKEIYAIVTEPNTVEAYDVFIRTYPENPYVDSAWWQMYKV